MQTLELDTLTEEKIDEVLLGMERQLKLKKPYIVACKKTQRQNSPHPW